MDIKDYTSLLNKSNDILLLTPPNPSDDVLSSAFATFHFLEKGGKKATLVSANPSPKRLSFLKEPKKTIDSLSGLRDFVLVFNTERNKIIDLSHEHKEGEFIVRITPEKGSVDPRDFSFVAADFKHDLLIILGAPSLESLGEFYNSNTDLFFEVPKINIDNKSANENFGQANIVDMTATSVAEICANLFFEHNEKHIDQHIAQSLLTGIISGTESFQKSTTTPKAMVTAAKLMKFKADQATVIRHLYKTKSFSFLKLWGRVMARLNLDEKKKIAWSLISTEDFVQSRASEKDIPFILEELQKNFTVGNIFAVFYPASTEDTLVQIGCSDDKKCSALARKYEIEMEDCSFTVLLEKKNLLEAEKDFLKKIKDL